MSRNIVFIGETESCNLGDSVICKVLTSLFKRENSLNDVILLDISVARRPKDIFSQILGNKFYTRFYTYFDKYIYYYSLLYYFLFIPYGAKVCFVGGALIQNFFADSLLAVLSVCRYKNCSLEFFSLGCGPLEDRYISQIEKKIKKIKKVELSFRDSLDVFGNRLPLSQSPDVAICSNLYYGNIKHKREHVIGIGVIDVKTNNNIGVDISIELYRRCIITIVKEVIRRGWQVELFCNGELGDYAELCRIKEMINLQSVHIAKRPGNDMELVSCVSGYEYVIASRLHALIIAYSYKIPIFGLSWDKKIQSFLNYVGLENNCVDLSDLKLEYIDNIVDLLFDTIIKTDVHESLQSIVLEKIKNI